MAKREVIGSIMKSQKQGESDYIKLSKDIILKKGDTLSLESKASKIKFIKDGMESGKLSEEFGNKLLEEAEAIPDFVRFRIIKVNKE